MLSRKPDIQPENGPLVWSIVPEFSLTYNGYSVVIPYVEHYLNNIMQEVRQKYCQDNPRLQHEIDIFIHQEALHSQFHTRFNRRMHESGFGALTPLVTLIKEELKIQRETRSLAFNIAYCAGFESISTYVAKYLYTQCDEFFHNASPPGANLLLWHVAEEFEHRAVCHDAFQQVSGNYFTRIHGLLWAFCHVGSRFMQAEKIVLNEYRKNMSPTQRKQSVRQSRKLFWRQLRYVAPRMLRIMLPWYNPSKLAPPPRISAALAFYQATGPIDNMPDFTQTPRT
ncbi:MAG: metal-dependent hydrolase [Tissierellales bacterium]